MAYVLIADLVVLIYFLYGNLRLSVFLFRVFVVKVINLLNQGLLIFSNTIGGGRL
jgi:hypothetical protein